ncbi:MAG: glycosyltransferase [Desulfovibrionaceae bacterium]|nr:glycosyltransferase [Desulfovibrionaceae bacterium]MBF0513147.1 glycosyltransferase [Desulfovibrionaceae bacterium]
MTQTPVTLGILASSLHVGGAEQLLLEFLRRLDRAKFTPRLYLLRELGPVGDEIKALGVACRAEIQGRDWGLIVPVKLASLFALDKVRVLMLVNHRNALAYGVPAAKLARVKAVVNWENETFKRYRFNGAFMALRRLLTPGVDAFVAAARGHANYLVERERVPARKVLPIVNAVDPSRFRSPLTREQAKEKLGVPPGRKTAGILAVLRPDKAHDLFLRAAARVVGAIDAHFLVIGDGPLRQNLEDLARELGIHDRVSFLGFRREGLPDVLAALDLVCLSSKPMQETLSVAALEAMSTGIPMLATRVGFMEEIVIPGETGLLVDSGDLDGYAGALRRLLSDDEARLAMGRRAKELVLSRHTLDAMARGFEELFATLLGPSPDLARLRGPEALRLCLIVSWPELGQWRLLQNLRARVNKVDVICPAPRGPRAPVALRSALQALCALTRLGGYNLMVSWSTNQGVCLGLALRFVPRALRPEHICRDFHFDPTRSDTRYRLKLALLRLALPGIDRFWCTSRSECAVYAKRLGLAPERLSFYPDEPHGELIDRPRTRPGDYVLAYGNSDRDYQAVLRAAQDLAAPAVILTQAYALDGPLPANVRVIRDRLDNEALARLIEGAAVVVVPTVKRELAAGQNVMLEAMSLSRPVVAAANVATVEYSEEGDAAYFYEPGDDRELLAKLAKLFADPDQAAAMGERGFAAARRLLDDHWKIFLSLAAKGR